MIYGLNPALFVEDGPAVHAGSSQRSSARAFEAWRAMDQAQRLALIEKALDGAVNDNVGDGFPVAL